MAKSKAELEADRDRYQTATAAIRSAEAAGDYAEALRCAVEACAFVPGMMQYERKYEDREFDTVDAIDFILTWAPPRLDIKSIETLRSILKTERYINNKTSVDLVSRLKQAESRLQSAHRLWSQLSRRASSGQEGRARATKSRSARDATLFDQWCKMGLVRRLPATESAEFSIVTQLNAATRAKCANCGIIAKAPKRAFLAERKCPKCGIMATFVLLEDGEHSGEGATP